MDPGDADKMRAVDLFQRAAAKGNLDAQYNLGVCLRLGLGVEADDVEAEHQYNSAARQGRRRKKQFSFCNIWQTSIMG